MWKIKFGGFLFMHRGPTTTRMDLQAPVEFSLIAPMIIGKRRRDTGQCRKNVGEMPVKCRSNVDRRGVHADIRCTNVGKMSAKCRSNVGRMSVGRGRRGDPARWFDWNFIARPSCRCCKLSPPSRVFSSSVGAIPASWRRLGWRFWANPQKFINDFCVGGFGGVSGGNLGQAHKNHQWFCVGGCGRVSGSDLGQAQATLEGWPGRTRGSQAPPVENQENLWKRHDFELCLMFTSWFYSYFVIMLLLICLGIFCLMSF